MHVATTVLHMRCAMRCIVCALCVVTYHSLHLISSDSVRTHRSYQFHMETVFDDKFEFQQSEEMGTTLQTYMKVMHDEAARVRLMYDQLLMCAA